MPTAEPVYRIPEKGPNTSKPYSQFIREYASKCDTDLSVALEIQNFGRDPSFRHIGLPGQFLKRGQGNSARMMPFRVGGCQGESSS